ncbi:Anaphase promoting complex subunit 7 [Cladochytrium tenue]|nr:Anaphase promoting complex subunit 7 [Cladochytrium tenue]
MARHCEMSRDYDRALVLIEQALALDCRNSTALCVKGLMESYMACGRFKEALTVAQDSVMAMPKNAGALTLVGIVLSHIPDCKDKVRSSATMALRKALQADPKCLEALFAIEHYNAALLLNPNYEPATKGIARVECLINGDDNL